MTTAYLLAVFRLDGDVPVFLRTEIFGGQCPDVGNLITFEVHCSRGNDFREAVENLIKMVSVNRRFEWALRSLVQR